MKNDNFYTFGEYMKENKLTISEEDYLEMIFRLCLKGGYTRVSDLAESLNVKRPSVSNMLKRLLQKKLINHTEYGVIQLTNEGRKLGKVLLDRHQTVEQFLQLLNVNDNVLEETEKIEHTLSPNTINNIKQLVTFFQSDDNIFNKYKDWIQNKKS